MNPKTDSENINKINQSAASAQDTDIRNQVTSLLIVELVKGNTLNNIMLVILTTWIQQINSLNDTGFQNSLKKKQIALITP